MTTWTSLYQPKSFEKEEFILPDDYRKIFQEYSSGRMNGHLLLTGTPGTGKTTAAQLLLKKAQSTFEIDCSQNSSAKDWKEGGKSWQSLFTSFDLISIGLTDKEREDKPIKRCVLLEEFDSISSQGVFKILLDKASEHGITCILTSNHLDKIDKAVQNRCLSLDFGIQSDAWMNFEQERFPGTRNQIEEDLVRLLISILRKEAPKSEDLINTSFDKIEHFFESIIKEKYPSVRGIIVEMRKWIIDGSIDIPSRFKKVSH